VYELTPAGGGTWTEQVLHSFGNGTDASLPFAGLTFDTAGNLYGATEVGGTSGGCAPYGCGTVFELTPAGGGTWTEKVVYSFGKGTDGAVPYATLIFDTAGNPAGSLGYLTLWPDLTNQPTVSTLNAADGFVASNMAIVPSTNGKVDAFANGITQLVLDISAYFAP
jgi:hypothetical protein